MKMLEITVTCSLIHTHWQTCSNHGTPFQIHFILSNFQMKDGVLQIDVANEIAKKAFGSDEQTVAIITKINEECAALEDPDRCEVAHKRFVCAKEGAEKNGLLHKKTEQKT